MEHEVSVSMPHGVSLLSGNWTSSSIALTILIRTCRLVLKLFDLSQNGFT